MENFLSNILDHTSANIFKGLNIPLCILHFELIIKIVIFVLKL